MKSKLEEVAPGLYIRRDTPKRVQITDEFVNEITRGDESGHFRKIVEEIARKTNKAISEKPVI